MQHVLIFEFEGFADVKTVKHPIWLMLDCMNSCCYNNVIFTYVFIDYFKILDLQGCLNVHFKQFIRRQEVSHEDTAHDRCLELGEVGL